MSFFKGQETYSMDSKGRVNVPAKMRKSISPEANDTFILTKGTDKCIYAYPWDEWKVYEESFKDLNQFDPKKRYFLRSLLMWSEEVTIDSSQRISIPKKLAEFAGIEKKVCLVGMVDHIELWNPDTFEEYMASHDETYEEVASKVMAGA
ncbi:MAG: division/cell wall cluster transcriptional repressor MraZ [Candidatus Kapaibacteriales bacterium]